MKRASYLVLLAAGLIATGCGDSDPAKPATPQTDRLAWIGTLTGAPQLNGDIVIDLTQTGSAIQGETVFASDIHVWFVGSASSDSIFLTPDPSYPAPAGAFSLRARILPNGDLSGSMAFTAAGISADLSCRALAWRHIEDDVTRVVPYSVIALAYDESSMWLSTTGDDFVRMSPGGTIVDTVVIYHDPLPAHWTTSAFTYDGALLWGMYPITIMGPGGLTNVADLLAFTASGRAPDSVRVTHRPNGLAHDGARVWSLRADPAALLELDVMGGVIDSLHLAIPDAIGLAFDGTHFWTAGWFLQRLYEVDPNGQVVGICDLGDSPSGRLPVGLAAEGSHVWFAAGLPGGPTTLHRMTFR